MYACICSEAETMSGSMNSSSIWRSVRVCEDAKGARLQSRRVTTWLITNGTAACWSFWKPVGGTWLPFSYEVS